MGRVRISNGAHEAEARKVLEDLPQERLTFYRIPTNEPWCRDHGPIFLTRNSAGTGRLAVVDWDYNAWGGKYPPCDLDEVVPTRIDEILDLPVFYPRMILEGGSIDVNGAGALLTTESCLLNTNRNPELTQRQIERRLRDFLGVHEILWIGAELFNSRSKFTATQAFWNVEPESTFATLHMVQTKFTDNHSLFGSR